MSKASMLFNNIEQAVARSLDKHLPENRRKMAAGDAKRYRRILVEQIHRDLELPAHVQSQYGSPLLLRCTECNREDLPEAVCDVGDFADRHAHCLAWLCPTCQEYEYDYRSTCRYCDGERGGAVADAKVIVPQIVVRYTIRIAGQNVAHVMAPSLLRARRAARGMYPTAGMGLTVASDHGVWTASYGHRKEGP